MPSIKIDNIILTFTNIYYVDAVNGLDTNTGVELSPFKTVSKAVTLCAITGDAVFLKGATSESIIYNNKTIYFIGDYKLYGSKIIGQLGGTAQNYTTHANIYKIYLQQLSTAAWAEMLVYMGICNLYNCIIDDASGYSEVYGTAYNHYNCLILKLGTLNYGTYNFTNCAIVKASITGSVTTSLYNVTYDPITFELTSAGGIETGTGTNPDGSKSNIGLYGGTYSWNIFDINFYECGIIKNIEDDIKIKFSTSISFLDAFSYKVENITKGTILKDYNEDIILMKL